MKLLDKILGKSESKKAGKKGGKTALVVDDENNIRQIMKIRLNQQGFNVLEAGSVEEAIATMNAAQKIHLFVIDIKLPGANGTVFARKIRKDKKNKDRPIIFISGHVVPSEMDKLSGEIGNMTYLTKPIKADEINAAVKQAMDGGFPH